MSKFEQDARLLLDYVGGKENIQAVTHCVTRMRFVLVDPSKADIDAIECYEALYIACNRQRQVRIYYIPA